MQLSSTFTAPIFALLLCAPPTLGFAFGPPSVRNRNTSYRPVVPVPTVGSVISTSTRLFASSPDEQADDRKDEVTKTVDGTLVLLVHISVALDSKLA